jgi:DNA gyrase/topoisomerase IV subunit B
MSNNYDVGQISSLEGLKSVQCKPAMYVGSTSQDGVNQIIYEVWDNSFDEYNAGYGNSVDVLIDKDNYITIEDHGRGIPVGPHATWKNPDGTPQDTLTGVLTRLHSGKGMIA